MTEKQIDDLLIDNNFSDEEREAFTQILEYAKECQQTNNLSNIKPYIIQIVNKIVEKKYEN